MGTIARWIIWIIIASLAASCHAPREPLRIGILIWPPYDLAYLAVQEGYIDEHRIEFIEFQTPSELVRSYRHDLVDAMFVTTQFSLTNLESMADTRIVYAVDFSFGGDALLAQPEITSPEDLRGKRIGVEAASLGIYTLIRALGQTGLTVDDVEVVFVDTPDQLAAFKSKSVNAVTAYEPTRTRLLNIGANEIFNSRSIPLEIIDVFLTREATIDARQADLEQVVRGLDRALSDYRSDPEFIASRLADRHAMTADEFKRAMASVELLDLATNVDLLNGEDDRLRQGLLRQCQVMQKAGLLRAIPDLEPLLDQRVVRAAAAAR